MLVPQAILYPFTGGGMLGYAIYDVHHYFLHHSTPTWHKLKELKRYHMTHHYKDWDHGYGITTRIWDSVFGTYLKQEKTI